MSDLGSRRGVIVLAVFLGLVLSGGLPALAGAASVTVDDSAPAVEEVAGGGYKLSVGLTNITDQPVAVQIVAPASASTARCVATVTSGTPVPAASHSDVDLHFGPGCTADDVDTVGLRVGQAGASQSIALTPKDPVKARPDWNLLWAFLFCLLGASLFVCVLGVAWNVPPSRELANLPDTWKFSDSLVTNVTVIGGALAGIVGSSGVVKAFLGKDADTSIALATVGVAVAAGVIGLGVVVLQTSRRNAHFTVGGLMAAAAIVLGGAYGELYVVWQNARDLTLGGWQGRLWAPAGLLALLLLAYAYVNLKETLEQGLAAAKPDELKLSADAITAIVVASKFNGDLEPGQLITDVNEALEQEHKRRADESKESDHAAAPKPRVNALRLVPKSAPSGKAALL